jgi:hypothetical protein
MAGRSGVVKDGVPGAYGDKFLRLHSNQQKGSLLLNPMPMELQIIRAQEFIRLGAHGRFDLKASKLVLAELAAACWKRGIHQALLDLRALHPGPKPVFSPRDLATLVKTFREIGFTQDQRLAVLYGSDPHHRARLFAFIANLRGWQVRAFGDFEAALTWLSEGQTEAALPAKTQEIPIRKPQGVNAVSAKSPAIPVKSVKTQAKAPSARAVNPAQ